jgi:hypothetical protein
MISSIKLYSSGVKTNEGGIDGGEWGECGGECGGVWGVCNLSIILYIYKIIKQRRKI